MTEPYVGSYDERIREAFNEVLRELPPGYDEIIEKIWTEFSECILDRIHEHVTGEMLGFMRDAICYRAAEVAEEMLKDALAGEDKEIRNLFGFTDRYIKNYYTRYSPTGMPTQWKLIDALVERRPELFVDERIAQRDREIELLERDIKNQHQRYNELEDRLNQAILKERSST